MILLTSYFGNPERKEEFDLAYSKNVKNPFITKIIVLLESGKLPFLDPKVEVIEHDRPTYADFFFHFIEGEINIIANSDIFLDKSIELAQSLVTDRNCLAITRHELTGGTIKKFDSKPEWSQDVWIFRSKPKNIGSYETVIAQNLVNNNSEEIPFYLGVAGCDNHVAYKLHNDGFNLVNPYPKIRCIHVHKNKDRDYQMKYRITGKSTSRWGSLRSVKQIR